MFPILCLIAVMLRSVRLAARLIKLTAQEYADTYGVDIRTAYNELKGAVHTLMKRTLSWQITDGKKIGTRTTIWVQGYDYFKDEALRTY